MIDRGLGGAGRCAFGYDGDWAVDGGGVHGT